VRTLHGWYQARPSVDWQAAEVGCSVRKEVVECNITVLANEVRLSERLSADDRRPRFEVAAAE